MIFTFDVQNYKALNVKWTLFKHTTVEAERIMRPWHQISNLQLYDGENSLYFEEMMMMSTLY
jgi:hypothetical protein